MQTERQAFNKNKDKILKVANELNEDEYLRLRKLAPRESLRLMGISEKHIDRMLHPREELAKLGYSEEEINKMLVVEMDEAQIYKQAGNSIVVDVLFHLFRKMFIDYDEPDVGGSYNLLADLTK